MRLRPVSHPDDLASLEALFQLAHQADRHWPIGEHKYLDLVRGETGASVGIVAEDAGGEVVGYLHLTPNRTEGGWGLEIATHPLRRTSQLVHALLDAALGEVKRSGGESIHYWVHQSGLSGIMGSHGFEQDRELRQLRMALPPDQPVAVPDDISIRPFRVGVDEDAWIAVNNVAFAGHPENGNWTREVLLEREKVEWFDPGGFRMAWAGERLAAFCWTKVHPDGMGEIYVIAVHPDFQGRGLGRAVVVEGLWYLYEQRNCGVGMLYVDASNTGALRLYDRLGFELDHVDRAFVWRSPVS